MARMTNWSTGWGGLPPSTAARDRTSRPPDSASTAMARTTLDGPIINRQISINFGGAVAGCAVQALLFLNIPGGEDRMYGYSRSVVVLLLLMCMARAGIAGFGYLAPQTALALYGLDAEPGTAIEYLARVWGVRDVILALLVATADRSYLKTLIWACIAIEFSDIFAACKGYVDGYFTYDHLVGQLLTVGVALVPESLALGLICLQDRRQASVAVWVH